MKVQEMREALTQLGSLLTSMKAKSAADDVAALCDLLAEYDEETVQGFVKGIRKRLEEKPAPAKKAKAPLDQIRVLDYARQIADGLQGQGNLEAALAQLSADKGMRLAEIKALSEQAMGFSLTEKSRPKALAELRRLLARRLHGQHRLDLA